MFTRRLFTAFLGSLALAAAAAPHAQADWWDWDNRPTISVGDATVLEGDAGQKQALVKVSLSRPVDATMIGFLTFGCAGDTATSGQDYDVRSEPFFIPNGQQDIYVTVPVKGDRVREPAETFCLRLADPGPAFKLGKGEGIVTIVDNDSKPSVAVSDVTAPEDFPAASVDGPSFARFRVSLSNPSSRDVVVHFQLLDGSARAGSDYEPIPSPLTIRRGQTTNTIAVPIVADRVAEPEERFGLTLSVSGKSDAILSDGDAVATIVDND